MANKGNSDPLPFTQVDRSVKPKAALLAGMLGVTNQHALGSLIEWWELFGDPREIERLIGEGISDIIVSPEEAERRFRIASGKAVTAADLVALGLLAEHENGVRVRGMSRYFEPVLRRLQAREAAAKGGKISAARRSEGAQASRLPSAQAAGDGRAAPPPQEAVERRATQSPENRDSTTCVGVSGAATRAPVPEIELAERASAEATEGRRFQGETSRSEPKQAGEPFAKAADANRLSAADLSGIENVWRSCASTFGAAHLEWDAEDRKWGRALVERLLATGNIDHLPAYTSYLFNEWPKLKKGFSRTAAGPVPTIRFAAQRVGDLFAQAVAWDAKLQRRRLKAVATQAPPERTADTVEDAR